MTLENLFKCWTVVGALPVPFSENLSVARKFGWSGKWKDFS